MYCPACEKEFSPVHSRCPECKGWLRVSGPSVGSGGPGPAIRTAPALGDVDTATTQKVPPLNGPNVPLPSRPKAAPAVAAAPAGVRGGGLAGDWPEPAERSAPPLQSATEPLSRGGLGAGWESASPVAASPVASSGGWGAPVGSAPPAQGGWGAPAAPAAGLGGSWQAPQAEPPKMGGWGAPAAAPQVGLGAAGSFGSTPSLGHSAPMGPPPAAGGGWLGDGGGGAYAAPAARSHGWLGDEAPAAPSAAPALSMPSITPPEVGSGDDALSLPEHTVAVDLGTPWEEEAQASASNKMIYVVLACLLLSLVGFSGYVWWQREKLKETKAPPQTENTSVIPTGLMYLKQGQAAYAKRKWEEAQSNGELAFTLLAELKVAKPSDRQAVKQFHRQATIRYGQALYDQAQAAFQKQDTNAAIGLSERAAEMYHKIPGTEKQQAQARALEGRIYDSIGDSAGAVSAYKKAHELNPSGGYGALVNQARQAGRPAPAQTQPQEVVIPVEQPSLGDGGSYPTGRPPSGRYVGRTAPPPAAQPVGPAPKPRPANTYVPPKRDTTPSWRRKGSDVLPTYR